MKLIASALLLAACGAVAHDEANLSSTSVTIDSAQFVDDGARWWAPHAAGLLPGTSEGWPAATVDVSVQGRNYAAQIDDGQWALQLPDGSIGSEDTAIAVTVSEPGGAHGTRQQVFALDSTPPIVTKRPSPFVDERGDRIDFTSGEPVHDHLGDEIDLAAEGCAPVYKYAYLADAAPVYGRELTTNALRFHVNVEDTKVAAVEYRIRLQEGLVVRDWAPVEGSRGEYAFTVHRDGDLLSHYEIYRIEVRARDWAGLEDVTSFCMEYEALAAPLDIASPAIATGDDGLGTGTLAAKSPV